ncbi:HTH-type transcriptional regulator BetI [Alloactinosynnema sp. L-07]|uniref:TetR/AcrR family transcriptional regulator n=1 Tax=Alloactinosynnema sp. L-07 TaxID=1653480 RepID=UPI00065EFF93|nr:TetR/AcrR family transcriptional regulator [Alloactinosynnema sp. L-07]CRK56559.1 HTH-type transcriptional regulator BetI [Alloactinosynnema sp. L-07]
MSERQKSILEAAVRVIARTGVRGLRVEELAAEAGVSTALIYYHFGDRAGLLRQTLEFVSDTAGDYTTEAAAAAENPRAELELLLLLEIQDNPVTRANSVAWGELRASAVFDDGLREQLSDSTAVWVGEVADVIQRAMAAGLIPATVDPVDAAERLTALVEGLSERWLSGSMAVGRAQELLRAAITMELGDG